MEACLGPGDSDTAAPLSVERPCFLAWPHSCGLSYRGQRSNWPHLPPGTRYPLTGCPASLCGQQTTALVQPAAFLQIKFYRDTDTHSWLYYLCFEATTDELGHCSRDHLAFVTVLAEPCPGALALGGELALSSL